MTSRSILTASVALLAASTIHAPAQDPGAFAKANYTTPLADVCPSPFIIQ